MRPRDHEMATILRLLARDVDLEADAMGEAESARLRTLLGRLEEKPEGPGPEGA